MAAGGRGRQTEADASSLNNVERLLLCQCVYEYGSNSWPEVAKVLSAHPMISRPKTFFTPQTCSVIYTQLMQEAQLECSDALAVRRASLHHKLASIHWQRRIQELKDLIAAEESRFKTLVAEIDDIRAGRWDEKVRTNLGLPTEDSESHKDEESRTEEPATEQREATPAVDIEIDEVAGVQESLEVASETHISESEVQEVQESDLTSVDQSSPSKAVEEPLEDVHETEEVPEIDLTGEDETKEHEDTVPAPQEPEQGSEDDVDMVVEDQSSPFPAPPSAAPEEAEEPTVTPAAEAEDDTTAQAGQDEEPPPPTPAESPETALADMIEDTNQAKQGESPESTASPDEAQRADGKRKATDLDDSLSDSARDKKRPREDSEPADDEEAAPSTGLRRRIGRPPAVDNPVVSKRFQNMIGMLHSQISQHRYGNIFHNPIRKAEAPDYHDIVKRPMDLKTIKSRIKDGLIANSLEFQRDVYLMFANAMMYNRPGSEIYNMAEEMMQESEVQINAFRQTEGFHRT
ncbi:uncharacterized protein C8Q71DRAFT_732083 [Rhodofomes roseus]|uniref:Bromo domain-containing protein n=1 Tax=Rhodofomes roseus TaxID=34475 RepID=A0ABQ8KYB6_9APHY|nr:uncharacterized protein C8Q71DRAFT_732083 [Rhodofomes roseus]KAH9844308.1 hypothetical protein C8Q71DRAFT_732083 [Rhodofomes roseus]